MKTPVKISLTLLAVVAGITQIYAQGTAFTYQGRLNSDGSPANGFFDITFSVWTSAGGPAQVGGILTNTAVAVSNGLFTVALDFGATPFTGEDRWLEIDVRTNGGGAFANLTPRQKLTAAPYAIMSGNLSGTLPASQLTGTMAAASLPTGGNWPLSSTLTLDSSTLAVDPVNHRVGIGTSSPSTPLTVLTPGAGYGIEHTDGTRRLSTYLNEGGAWLGSVSADKLNFFVNNGGNSLTVDLAGNVGIGTAFPAYPLHLVGGLGGMRLDSTSNPNGSVLELRNTMASPNYLGAINFNNAAGTFPGQIGYLASHNLTFRTAGAERMRLDANGRVGIGTPSPAESLHVNGNVRVDGAITVSEVTRFLSVSPAAWTATSTAFPVVAHTGLGSLFAFSSGVESFWRMVAPVQLPHGARIDYMYARVYDYSSTAKVEIQLRRDNVLTGEMETIATMGTTVPDEPIVTLVNPVPPFSHTVNNQFNSYFLYAWVGTNTGVGTVVIRYTVTSPLP